MPVDLGVRIPYVGTPDQAGRVILGHQVHVTVGSENAGDPTQNLCRFVDGCAANPQLTALGLTVTRSCWKYCCVPAAYPRLILKRAANTMKNAHAPWPERGPGCPEIGTPINVRLGDKLLSVGRPPRWARRWRPPHPWTNCSMSA